MDDGEDDEAGFIPGLDMRVRLLAAVGAAFVFSAFRHLPPALLGLGAAAGLLALRRPPVAATVRQALAANVFIAFMAITIPLSVPGEALFRLGPLAWSREGAALALLVAVKANAILGTFLALVAGARLASVGSALAGLRVPDKLTFLFLFASRHLRDVGDVWNRLWTAAALRGFVPRPDRHTYRTLANMLGLTFVGGVDRSRRVYEAMLLRGFHGAFHPLAETGPTRGNARFAALFSAFLAGLLLLDLWPE